MKSLLIILFLIAITTVPLAYAHPLLISSDPPQSTAVPAGVSRVVIHFSEAVELDYSYIKVLDSDGNQIDNKDLAYFGGTESSLVVTTPPLQDGLYTVTTQVLSKVDGHLVPYAFVFGVGDVAVPETEHTSASQAIYFPEAAARFPGLVGQTIVLGCAIAAVLLWNPFTRREIVKENLAELQKAFQSKFFTISGIGLFSVFASNILMLVVQTIRLQTSAADVLTTTFGETWIIRMGITVVLLAVWFLIENKSNLSSKKHAIIIAISLPLLATTTIIGHGAASEQMSALIIDYIHNVLAAVWIGGVIFFAFVVIPVLAKMADSKRDLAALVMIPKFSSIVLIAVGILIITGPTLLWLLEDDVSLLSQSYYGYLILAKILIGLAMIALGGYNQVRIQRPAELSMESNILPVHKKLKRSLKTEALLGIALLGVVALLTNSSLPAGQATEEDAGQVKLGFDTSLFSENSRYDVSMYPFSPGQNTISVVPTDLDGEPLQDVSSIAVKISNPQRNVTPIEIPMTRTDSGIYEGEVTFGFAGTWDIEIITQRTQNPNEVASFSAVIKPRLSQLKTEITEFDLPDAAAPLYPAYDGDDTIWISDSSKPRIWKFSISQEAFESFEFEGQTTVFLKLEGDRIWFTDTPNSTIGYFDLRTEQFTLIPLPKQSIAISLETDLDGNLWIALVDQHSLLRYSPETGEFEEYKTPTSPSGPVALTRDSSGMIWFAESQGGKIGAIDPQTGEIEEFAPDSPMGEPFAIYIDREQNVWIAEHVSLKITKFNPYLQSFESFAVTDPESLPFGLAPDKFDNIWVALHTVDKLGVFDPHFEDYIEVNIPTASSFAQFATVDKDGNIWFVEQRANKLGVVTISETPQFGIAEPEAEYAIKYSELTSPLISAGIVAASLFFVKSIHDKRRLYSKIR